MHILYWTGRALTRVLSRTLFGWQVTGREHVPPTGGFILAGNHISYYDPNLLGSSISREVYFFGKEELFSIPVVGWAIRRTNAMPVKRGAVDRAALKMAIGTIQKGHGLTIFPEGTRSKTGDFLEPRAGVGLIASHAKCPIVPVYIHGSNRLKECFGRRGQLSVTIGEPFSADWVASFGDNKEGYLDISRAVMARIAELQAQVIGAA